MTKLQGTERNMLGRGLAGPQVQVATLTIPPSFPYTISHVGQSANNVKVN